jgi:hypothetical protein
VNVALCLRRLGLLALAVLSIAPASAHAIEIVPGGVTLDLLNRAGEPEVRAGAHPDRLVEVVEFSDPDETKEDPKDMVFDFAPGLNVNPGSVPPCPRRLFDEVSFANGAGCRPQSQVGVAARGSGESERSAPLYSVEPGPNEAGLFGIQGFPPLKLLVRLRPEDQGLSVRLNDLPQVPGSSLSKLRLEFWGIPADHQEGTSIPRKAMLSMPSRCDGPLLTATAATHTWQQPDRWVSGVGEASHPLVGCEELPFEPDLGFSLTAPVADSLSGVGIDLTLPQNEDPAGLATSQLKDANIALPKGMTISPGGANALEACGDAQFGLGTATEVSCPSASKVGTVELDVPSLAKPLAGSIYLATETPTERIRLFIAASAKGSEVKLAGALHTDPQTGELSAALNDLPEASFERMSLHFDGGPGALLATPLACAPATTTATLTPYSATTPIERQSAVELSAPGGSACPAQPPFVPTFSGGATDPRPGHTTAFTATVHRRDGEELPERLQIELPPGLSAALGSVEPCSTAALAKESCPSASRLGKALAELGPGDSPASIDGEIYLTGPYRKAPFGLALLFKANLGPFDLGSLSIRATLGIDPLTGQVTLATDPLPSAMEGIPIRFQTLGLDLERPGFMRNPTSCAPAAVNATLYSGSGAIALPSSSFALQGCIALPFAPKLSVALANPFELRAGGRPSLRLGLRTPAKSANLRSLQVTFPKLLKLDSNGLSEICARRAAMKGECPKGSRVGSATAKTPLLQTPMKGSLYVAQPPDDGPPDIWAHLAGDGLEVDLRGQTGTKDGHPLTKFTALPDFPIGSLALVFSGGPKGLIELRGDPCGARRLFAPSALGGQNGARAARRVRVGVDCGG